MIKITKPSPLILKAKKLTPERFQPFGEIIECEGKTPMSINQGTTKRFDDLALLDLETQNGRPAISIFKASARPQPILLEVMERHPLGSQAFYPLYDQAFMNQAYDGKWLVVVAKKDCSNPIDKSNLHAFIATKNQGVNYAKNVWNHPLLVLHEQHDFIIIDRKGRGINLEECYFKTPIQIDFNLDGGF
ncbi:MAG: ureidoglycolate lyase [Pseudomonadota bacterium]